MATNTINLYTNNYVAELRELNENEYELLQFGMFPRTKGFDKTLIQLVKMNNFSDSNWGVSLPNRDILKTEFDEA